MHAISTRQRLDIAVLREQRYGRCGLASQHRLQIFDQRKAGALNHSGSIVAAGFWPLHKFLYGGFHGPQNQRRWAHAHHFQRTASLVQLLACYAQGPCIQGRKI